MKIKDNKVQQYKEYDTCWILQIPDELKLEVLKNLSPKDLVSVSETCSELNGLIKEERRLWTELTVDLSESRRSLLMKVERYPWLNTLKVTNKTGLQFSDTRHANKIYNLVRRTPLLTKIIFIDFYVEEEDFVKRLG